MAGLVSFVMAGLVPAIHVFLSGRAEDVDGRDKPGHDGVQGSDRHFGSTLGLTLPGF
jgi:hypothetical protein